MIKISGKRITEEYLKQDFFPHEMGNGTIIMISDDRRYYY